MNDPGERKTVWITCLRVGCVRSSCAHFTHVWRLLCVSVLGPAGLCCPLLRTWRGVDWEVYTADRGEWTHTSISITVPAAFSTYSIWASQLADSNESCIPTITSPFCFCMNKHRSSTGREDVLALCILVDHSELPLRGHDTETRRTVFNLLFYVISELSTLVNAVIRLLNICTWGLN